MDPQAKTPIDVKTNARRRLIRGSFSVPAVLAVHNGSALAASSNKFRCAVNATTGNTTLPGATTSADSWTRVRVYRQGQKYYVKVADLQTVKEARGLAIQLPTGTPAPKGSEGWVEYKSKGSYTYASVSNRFNPSMTSTSTAVLFAPDGGTPPKVYVKGFVQPDMQTGTNVGAISASCWTSIM